MGNREVDGFHIWAEASQRGRVGWCVRLDEGCKCQGWHEALQSAHCAYFYVLGPRKQHQSRSYKRSHQFPTLLAQPTRLLNMGGVSTPLDLKVESGLR